MTKEIKSQKKRSGKGNGGRMKRILAIGILLFIFVTLLHFLYTAFTGGSKELLLAHLFLLMVVPAVFYVLQWITNLIRRE